MSWSFVQGKQAAAESLTFDSNIAAGNLLVVVIGAANTGSTVLNAPTDTQGNIWSQAGAQIQQGSGSNPYILGLYYTTGSLSAADTISFTTSGGSAFQFITIAEYHDSSGLVTTDRLDVAHVGSDIGAGGTSLSAGAMTTVASGDLILAAGATGGVSSALTAGSGFTGRVPADGMSAVQLEDQIQSIAGAITATQTASVSGPWCMVAAAFSPANALTTVPAGVATATVNAYNPGSAFTGTGSEVAFSPATIVSAVPATATATATAYTPNPLRAAPVAVAVVSEVPVPTVVPNASATTGTVAAFQPSIIVVSAAQLAAETAVSPDSAPTTATGTTVANAQTALAGAIVPISTFAITPAAELASSSVFSNQPIVALGPDPLTAQATAAATIAGFLPNTAYATAAAFDATTNSPSVSFLFTPPTENTVPNVSEEASPLANRLRRFYPVGPRGMTVWHLADDTISFAQPFPTIFPGADTRGELFPNEEPQIGRGWSNLQAITVKTVYLGGRTYTVNTAEAARLSAFLTAQGYDPTDWLVAA